MASEKKKHYAYILLMNEVLKDIHAGVYEVGSMLPTQVELAEKYNVSRLTAREALKELMRRGIIESTRGKGTVVLQRDDAPSYSQKGQVSGFSEKTEAVHHSQVLLIEKIPASKRIARELATEVGAALIHIVRLRNVDGEPVMLDKVYLPYDLVKNVTFDKETLEKGSLYRHLRNEGNIHFVENDEEFRAGLASEEDASYLNILSGEPVLYTKRYAKIQDEMTGELIVGEYSEHVIRTDKGPVKVKSAN